jgi:fumarate reductase subunit C
LSRWQWLVKWIYAIPHYVILFFLHIPVVVAWVITFFAILITGKYPRPLFDFIAYAFPPLIVILPIIAAVALLFTTRYPKGLYDFVIGINRWTIRVRAYSALPVLTS